jgi:hypothetical protein
LTAPWESGGGSVKVVYSGHLENRLMMRGIEHDLPREIFEGSQEKYFDWETRHFIAVNKVRLYGKIREVMVAYILEGDTAKIVTIHSLKEKQKENRIKTGRWRKVS